MKPQLKVWLKVILVPSMFFLAQILFKNQVQIPIAYYTLSLGLLMAVAAIVIEVLYLDKKNLYFTSGIDFVAATTLVYISHWVFKGSNITFTGALLTGLLVLIVEFGQHVWMLGTNQVWVKAKPELILEKKVKVRAKDKERRNKERNSNRKPKTGRK
ncbi:MAG TPA: hypothetical protein VN426_07545 [Syntrophomonadaceae bacterium]|nr:hypothetical protein [Syntrophomonadaceae bacterium]